MSRSNCCLDYSATEPSSVNMRAAFAGAVDELGRVVPKGTISVALIETRDWLPWLGDAFTMLSASEAERVRRRRIAADRDALVLAYALHRLLLGRTLGRDPTDVPIERDELGCPRVRGREVCTSLSHADDLIALAVAASGPVGVDVEPLARAAVMPEIARRVYHYSEATGLYVLGEAERNVALLAMWVRKEAVLKAAGVGLAVPMETFAAPEHASLRLPATLCAQAMQVRMLSAGDRCVAAVAGPCGVGIDCHWVRPALGTRAEETIVAPRPDFDPVSPAVTNAK